MHSYHVPPGREAASDPARNCCQWLLCGWRSARAARAPCKSRHITPPLQFEVMAAVHALARFAHAVPFGPTRASAGFDFGLPSHSAPAEACDAGSNLLSGA